MKKYNLILCFALLLSGCVATHAQTSIHRNPDNARISFAVSEITKSLSGQSVEDLSLDSIGSSEAPQQIVLLTLDDPATLTALQDAGGTVPEDLKAEGFGIRITGTDKKTCWIIGTDDRGAMYGGLDVAETIALTGFAAIAEKDQNPYLEKRGIKLNIPLDACTPSYADFGTAAQENIPEMWSWDFWTNHLDHLAKNRYNTITLWNLHHFPSIVKVPDYPDVALDDVKRSTYDFFNNHDKYHLSGRNMYYRSVSAPLVTLKTMTIDEKIQFWQDVMQYAHDRGIGFYLITWNVFVSSAGDAGYGISDDGNEVTKDYLRKSVKATLETYPLLKGMGVTAGENMGQINDQEKWLWDTYGEGLMDAKNADTTGRNFEFMQRVWWTNLNDIINSYHLPSDVTFDFSVKYARARLYSFTSHSLGDWARNLPEGSKLWLNLRNDDIFNFRWGDPTFVREFLGSIPENTRGFHMGSDGYVWGREFTSTEPENPRQLEVEKHWYKFMLWGRLGYDPTIPDAHFQKIVQARFPQASGADLYDLWLRASKIIPKVNRAHWNRSSATQWDFQWSVEYSRRKDRIFTSINGTSADAAELREHATYVLQRVGDLRGNGGKELRLTLGDLEAMAHLGNFYAAKMEDEDTEAAGHWRKYAAVASSQYNEQLLGRAGMGDWKEIYRSFDSNAPSVATTDGGILLEAEAGTVNDGSIQSGIAGYTGSGYVVLHGEGSSVTFNYDAPAAGEALLEFRYALAPENEADDLSLVVNGQDAGAVDFWNTGGASVWAWDRKVVRLEPGPNTIELRSEGLSVPVDHANLLWYGDSMVSLPEVNITSPLNDRTTVPLESKLQAP